VRLQEINIEKLHESVTSLMREYMGRGYFPSASVCVFDRERTLLRAAIGSVGPNTVYDVASLTKIATAAQVLLLAERGIFHMKKRITDCLPELARDSLLKERLANVTLFMLLTHTSGIADWYPFYALSGDFTQRLHTALEACGPVEGTVYSDLNFMLLGKAIEHATGKPLDECLQTLLVQPMGLGKMAYKPEETWDIAPSCYGNPIEEGMCLDRGIRFTGWRPHTPVTGEANDGNAYYYYGGIAGSAGIFAEPASYRKLCQFFMNSDTPLYRLSLEECAPGRGLGWQMGGLYPYGCGHTGFTGTSVYFSRMLNIGAAAFTNRLFYPKENPNATNDFRRALHETLAAMRQSV
jgi:CubicO group peptidase (beta-lactamase class C family)